MNATPIPGSSDMSGLSDTRLIASMTREVQEQYDRSRDAGQVDLHDIGVSSLELNALLLPLDLPTQSNTPDAVSEIPVAPSEARAAMPEAGTRGRRRYSFVLLLAADITTMALALVGGQLASVAITGRGSAHDALASAIYVPVFIVVLNCYGMYERSRRRIVPTTFPDLGRLAHALFAASLIVLFVAGGFHRWFGVPGIERVGATLIAALALVGIPLGRAIARVLVRHPERHGSRVLIVGSGGVAEGVARRLNRLHEVVVVGWVDDEGTSTDAPRSRTPRLGGLERLPSLVAEQDIDHVIVAFGSGDDAEVAAALRSFAGQVQISVVPRLFDFLTVRSQVDDIAGITVVNVAQASLGPADRFSKRALDVVVSAVILALLAPLLISVALAIKLTSPGPVLFRQNRTGRGGKSFTIYKFRTMRVGAESERDALRAENEVDGPLFKMRRDPRITTVGRRLRETSIDEFPQLINVFKGDMSLVGPRPFVTTESAEIGGWAARRFDVRPGMTGLWQISGRNDLPFEELCRLDHAYVASWSLWWDLRILWHTPGTVLHHHGAY
jgi:exopolysaccharide biosynthesis polyprenyl glycosylphosphotransferase